MRVLHICNGFAGSKVHSNLVQALEQRGLEQTVYCPVRKAEDIGGNSIESLHVKIVYSHIIKPWYHYMYYTKSKVLYNDLTQRVEIKKHSIIHAATLFSDGILAYKAFRQYGIPYVVAVRNTDYNAFIRLLKHTYPTGRKILLSASRIFFISAAIMESFKKSAFVKPILNKVQNRFELLPNGIDDYWIDNISTATTIGKDILYIGDFSENKNVERLIEAFLRLRAQEKFKDVSLTLIGGGKNTTNRVIDLIEQYPECINYLGKIYDKSRLAEIMRHSAVFAMPSIYETFGLVYVEALSQNLPVIYTKGQGIDGLFDISVGIAVKARSVNEIVCALQEILTHHTKYSNESVNFNRFRWSEIAEKYNDCYKKLIEKI